MIDEFSASKEYWIDNGSGVIIVCVPNTDPCQKEAFEKLENHLKQVVERKKGINIPSMIAINKKDLLHKSYTNEEVYEFERNCKKLIEKYELTNCGIVQRKLFNTVII